MMDRSQKKCLVVSSVFHGSLILLLLFGSALMPKPDDASAHLLKMWDPKKVGEITSGGDGSPDANVAPAPPAPPKVATETPPAPKAAVQPPAPTPKPVEILKPIPRAETPRPTPRVADVPKTKPKEQKLAKEEPAPPKKHKVVIDDKDLAIHKANANDADARALRDAQNRDARQTQGKQFAKALAGIKSNLSTSTAVDLKPSYGESGEATASYGDIIVTKYFNAWNPPADLDSDVPIVTVSVIILRDGTVKSAHIVTPSGNRSLDRSIENALETVTFIEQFPSGWKEAEKTVRVKFNLQLKRQNG